MLTWSKTLSTTDAQQPTAGGIVPYLRLTSSGLTTGNFQTWFRQTFFSCCSWGLGSFNNKPVEETYVPFDVVIQGNAIGTIQFLVTHDTSRQYNHNAPNTWLHWHPQFSSLLQANNYAGCDITLTRNSNNSFCLDIS